MRRPTHLFARRPGGRRRDLAPGRVRRDFGGGRVGGGAALKFVLNLARRELRSSWKRLLFFFLCIGVGVGSIVSLRSMIQNLNRDVTGQARELMRADVQVETTREWPEDVLAKINRAAPTPPVAARTETIDAPPTRPPARARPAGAL